MGVSLVCLGWPTAAALRCLGLANTEQDPTGSGFRVQVVVSTHKGEPNVYPKILSQCLPSCSLVLVNPQIEFLISILPQDLRFSV